MNRRTQAQARVDTRAENGIQFSRVVPAVWPPMKMWPALGYTGTTTSSKTSSKFKFDPFADDDNDDVLPGSHDSDYSSDGSVADISESTSASPPPAILPLPLDDIPRPSSFKFDPFADDDKLPDSHDHMSDADRSSTNASPTLAPVRLPPLGDDLPHLVSSYNTESDVDDESVPDWCSLENIKMRIIERRTVFDIHENDIELVQRATGLRRLKALAPKPFDPEQIHMNGFVDRPMDVQAVNDVDRFFNKGPRTNLKWYEEQDALNSNRGMLTGKVTSGAKLEQLVDAKYTRQREDGENRWLGLEQLSHEKKGAHPARVADVGQENIETVHEPEPIQATDFLCKDKVAVLWRNSAAHKPGYMKGLVPSSFKLVYIPVEERTDQLVLSGDTGVRCTLSFTNAKFTLRKARRERLNS
ncbi:hypothetical protein EV360DRAFT_71070 [Lentinula raphanica]|nr:hypothetical protein EV360DRAFT_71070 [Lentinula raphanica]